MQTVQRVNPPSLFERVASSLSPANRPPITTARRWTALALAITADTVQIALFPLFGEGILSPLNAATDVVVALGLTRLLGWHMAFLPGFILEQVPLLDLAPTWTLATLMATRGAKQESDPAPPDLVEQA